MATNGDNLLLGTLAEEAGLHYNRLLRQGTLCQNLAVSGSQAVDDWDVLGASGSARLLRHQGPQLLDVDGRAVLVVAEQVEVTHTVLSKVSGMVTVEEGAVMVHTTSVTATTWVLAVLADTTVTGRDVSALLSILLVASSLQVVSTFVLLLRGYLKS